MHAILTVAVHDRGKCVSTQPISLMVDLTSSFSLNAINQMASIITARLSDQINKAIPINQFKKIVRVCVESEFDIINHITIHDRYDIRYNMVYVG